MRGGGGAARGDAGRGRDTGRETSIFDGAYLVTAEIEGLEGDTAHLEFLGGRVLGGLVLLDTLVLEHVHEGGLAWGGRGRGRGGRGGGTAVGSCRKRIDYSTERNP